MIASVGYGMNKVIGLALLTSMALIGCCPEVDPVQPVEPPAPSLMMKLAAMGVDTTYVINAPGLLPCTGLLVSDGFTILPRHSELQKWEWQRGAVGSPPIEYIAMIRVVVSDTTGKLNFYVSAEHDSLSMMVAGRDSVPRTGPFSPCGCE